MYIEPKYGSEKMEVLLGDGAFPRLIEEYMGPDARRYFDEILECCENYNYNKGYNEGCESGYDDGYDDGYRDGEKQTKE